jgi:hypothetical protein
LGDGQVEKPSKGKAWIGTCCAAILRECSCKLHVRMTVIRPMADITASPWWGAGLSCDDCSHSRPHGSKTTKPPAEHIAIANISFDHSLRLLGTSRHTSQSTFLDVPADIDGNGYQIHRTGCLMLTSQPTVPSLSQDYLGIDRFRRRLVNTSHFLEDQFFTYQPTDFERHPVLKWRPCGYIVILSVR